MSSSIRKINFQKKRFHLLKIIEKLVPVLEEWNGYGPWDLYSMNICQIAKHQGVDVQQHILENQIVWFSDTGCLRNFDEYGGDGQLKTLYIFFH